MIKNHPRLIKLDKLVTGIAMYYCMRLCEGLSVQSGSVYNPALGLAINAYSIAITKLDWTLTPKQIDDTVRMYAVTMWVYMLLPFVGSILASLFVPYFRSYIP